MGYAVGFGSALLGKETAMALTVAVEEVIGEHYNDQLRQLIEHGYSEKEDMELREVKNQCIFHLHSFLTR